MALTESGNLFLLKVKVVVVVVFLSIEVILSKEVNFVVLLLSKEVLLLGEEPVFSVLLLSLTQGEERPPVLSREEVNKRE